MKKQSLFFVLLCTLCVFVIKTNAQTITDTREYGSWVFSFKNDNSDNHFTPKNKFPSPLLATSFKIAPGVLKKRERLVNVFKEVYPKPYRESVIFGFESLTKLLPNQVYGYNFHIGDYEFQYDNSGKIKPINYLSQFGNAYSGYVSIYVNTVPENILPENLSMSQISYDGKEYKTIDKLDIVPPQNNYEKDAKAMGVSNPASPLFKNAADKYNSFRYVSFTGTYPNIQENHKEQVWITADGQLPYTVLTKGQFLDFLKLKNELERKSLQLNFERTIKNEPKSVDHYTKMNNDNILKLDWDLKVIIALKEYNKNELTSPAIIHPEQLNVIRSSNLDHYYYNSRGGNSLQMEIIKKIFIADTKKGYSVTRYNKNYYNGLKPDEIKSMIVQWEYWYRPSYKPESGKPGLGKMQYYSDNPNTFFNAFMTKMDWDKLATLLTKQ
jgi:hypothetical protein